MGLVPCLIKQKAQLTLHAFSFADELAYKFTFYLSKKNREKP
jgi:hypothetical protein